MMNVGISLEIIRRICRDDFMDALIGYELIVQVVYFGIRRENS